jgi:AcrR family transcriptional regulator
MGNEAESAAGSSDTRRSSSGLSRTRVIKAAIRIGDEESLEALTMRRLAADLDVGTMTLYSYFRNKNALLDAIADYILGSLEIPPVAGHSTADGVRLVAHSLRTMTRKHPTIVRLFIVRTTRSLPAMIGSYEHVIHVLIELGFPPPMAVRVYGLLLIHALGFTGYTLPRPWGGEPTRVKHVARLRREREKFYRTLPADDFPVMTQLAPVLTTLPSGEQYEWGLDVIIAGLLAVHPNPVD